VRPMQSKELRLTLVGHTDEVRSVAFSPDSCSIVSGSDDKTIRIWDAESGELRTTLEGHTDAVCSVAYSPDSHSIASASDDKTLRVWYLRQAQPADRHHGDPLSQP